MGKLFVVLALASVALGGMDYEMTQKWQKLKAMESCWGEENMKLVMVDMKKAIAKCGHEDAPELSLPPYRSSYRFVNTMVNKADQYENMDNMVVMFAKMMSMMKNNRHNNYNNYETDSFRPYSQNYHQGSDNMNMMQKMMKMMKGQNYDNSYHMDSHNSNSDMMDMFSQMMNKMDTHSMDSYSNTNSYKKNDPMARMSNFMSNYRSRHTRAVDVKMFMKCCSKHKTKLCMNQDIKKKVESNFGPMEAILEETQLTEHEFFPLVVQLLHGEEMKYMVGSM